jgi:hypothetical protein
MATDYLRRSAELLSALRRWARACHRGYYTAGAHRADSQTLGRAMSVLAAPEPAPKAGDPVLFPVAAMRVLSTEAATQANDGFGRESGPSDFHSAKDCDRWREAKRPLEIGQINGF